MKHKIIVFFGIVIGLCLMLMLGYIVFVKIRTSNQRHELYDFAQQLGYTPVNEIAEYKVCWDIFPTTCGRQLYYLTPMDKDEFQNRLDSVLGQRMVSGTVDARVLFHINMESYHTLTVNGMDNSGSPYSVPEPPMSRLKVIEEDHHWDIRFYDIAQSEDVYRVDGQIITQNIVTIMLYIK